MTSATHITKAATSVFGPFIGEKGSDGLLNYKYTGQDCSILAPAMYKFWNIFFKLVPAHMSPNVVTITGISILGLATLWANLSDADDGFKCIIIAIAINFYQTADAVDGLQGKRVGMYQNPTTEMFDHGVDSVANVLTLSSMIQFMLGIKNPLLATIALYSSLAAFHAPTYEHLITGKMIFRGGPTNPTESLVIAQVVFILAGIFPSIFHGFLGQAFAASGAFVSALSLMNSVKSLYTFYNNDFSKAIHSALRGYSPLFFAIFTSFLWLPWNTKFYHQHPMLCLLTIALPWNYSIFRTILNEISGVKNLDTMSILKGQTAAIIPAIAHLMGFPMFWPCIIAFMLNIGMYAYTIVVSLREVCDVLGMDSWYSIRDERTINNKTK